MAGAGSSDEREAARDAVVVTGAAGFVGRGVCSALAARGVHCVGLVRTLPQPGTGRQWLRVSTGECIELCATGDLADCAESDLAPMLVRARAVVHVAGRAHVGAGIDARAALERDNVEAARRVAQAAAHAGVPRLVLVSSVKVNGERTLPGRPFRPADAPAPEDAYARSKLAAEQAMARALAGSATALTILRLPLVYGRDAPANFARLVHAVASGRPLPLASVQNRRSVLGLENLAAAIAAVLDAPSVVGTYFVADVPSLSTPDLVRAIAMALRTQARLVPVPVGLLRLAGRILGQRGAVARLTESLEVDTGPLQRATTWRPRALDLPPGALDPRR